jgi:two-component system sensor histidine kinase KdpD
LAAVEQRIGNRSVEIQLPDDLQLVSMDLVLMTQVLVNILDNAHKYAPAESTIEVSATTDNDWLSLEVADRGSGVPEHDLINDIHMEVYAKIGTTRLCRNWPTHA